MRAKVRARTAASLAAAALAAAAAIGAASTAQTGGAPPQADAARDGAESFAAACGMCHRPGGPGTAILARRMDPAIAPLEKREDLTADYVRAVVRTGLGNMPPLTKVDVADAQLEAIAAYLAKR